MCGEGLNYFQSDFFSNVACVSRDESCRGEELAVGRWVRSGVLETRGVLGSRGWEDVTARVRDRDKEWRDRDKEPLWAAIPKEAKWECAVQAAGRASALAEVTARGGFSTFSWWQQGRACPRASGKAFLCPLRPPPALSSALPAGGSQGIRRAAQPQVQVLGPAPPEAPRGGSVLLERAGVRRHRGQGGRQRPGHRQRVGLELLG